jgi:hypothetical protein
MAATATPPVSGAVGLPPGPPRLGPVHPLMWAFHPVQYVRECQRRFGDTFALDGGPLGTVVYVAHPEETVVLRTILERVELEAVGPPERQRPRNVTLVPSRGARARVRAVRA